MRRSSVRASGAILLALLGCAVLARAETYRKSFSFDELASASDVVAVGRVVSRASTWVEGSLYTDLELVLESVSSPQQPGATPGTGIERIRVRLPGGAGPSPTPGGVQVAEVAPGMNSPIAPSRALFFLKRTSTPEVFTPLNALAAQIPVVERAGELWTYTPDRARSVPLSELQLHLSLQSPQAAPPARKDEK